MNIKLKLHNLRNSIYNFLLYKCRMGVFPVSLILASVDNLGVEFSYKGDSVIWVWPWKRPDKYRKFISLSFTGTGEWGDVYFCSLEDLDKEWDQFYNLLEGVETNSNEPCFEEEKLG